MTKTLEKSSSIFPQNQIILYRIEVYKNVKFHVQKWGISVENCFENQFFTFFFSDENYKKVI